MPVAWLLNLDAEEELAAPAGWRRRPRLWRAIEAHRAAAARTLLADADLSLDPDGPQPGLGQGWRGRAWCPTPSALAQLAAAGARPEPAPEVSVLVRVNRRDFLLGQDLGLGEAVLIDDEASWSSWVLARDGQPARLKRVLGAAGRGQLTLAGGCPGPREEAWVARALAGGGMIAEPQREVTREFVTHGWLEPDGSLSLGAARMQIVHSSGAWSSTGAPVDSSWCEELALAAGRLGRALGRAGYFGPFGVDGYEYRDRGGDLRLQPASDLNARYTMGWVDPR